MPPIVCPSPDILDNTFPRSVGELRRVLSAVERLATMVQEERLILLLTTPLRAFIADDLFDWTRMNEFPQLLDIYNVLIRLALQQSGVERVDLSGVTAHHAHPVPHGCENLLSAPPWAEEIGKLYVLHNERCNGGDPFVAVACTLAFAGEHLGAYSHSDGTAHFALIGPEDVAQLSDSVEWDLPDGIANRSVSFDQAKNRLRMLGGSVKKAKGSSHYQVKFAGERTWPLDKNYRFVPDVYLAELEDITHLPLSVIKFVLINGIWPGKRRRLTLEAIR